MCLLLPFLLGGAVEVVDAPPGCGPETLGLNSCQVNQVCVCKVTTTPEGVERYAWDCDILNPLCNFPPADFRGWSDDDWLREFPMWDDIIIAVDEFGNPWVYFRPKPPPIYDD